MPLLAKCAMPVEMPLSKKRSLLIFAIHTVYAVTVTVINTALFTTQFFARDH